MSDRETTAGSAVSVTTKGRRVGEHLGPYEISPLTDAVPLPTNSSNQNRRYPFDDMEVGDSFTLPSERRLSMRAALGKFRRGFPERAFTWRVEGDRLRVWRTQ